jgi:hypothetical protein
MKKATGQLGADFLALLEQTQKDLFDLQYGNHAFNAAGLSSSGAQNTTKNVRYDTADTLTTVEGANYFNTYAATFETGDTLQVFSQAATDGGYRAYQVTATTGGTLTLARQEPERTVVQYSINETDLLAGAIQYVRSPAPGRIVNHIGVVQTTVVSGGTLTLGTTTGGAMTGGVISVSNGMTAGTPLNGTAITKNAASLITTGGVLTVTPSAGFDVGGAIAGEIIIDPTT